MPLIRPITGGPAPHRRQYLRLTAPLVPLLALAASLGVAWDGLYRDNASVVAQAVGQDWVTLVVAVPVLAIARVYLRRGSLVAHLVSLGVVAYAAYSYAIYAFSAQHNSLFLVYVAILGLSVYALVAGALALDRRQVDLVAGAPLAWRPLAALFAASALFFAVAWLGEQGRALVRGELPASVIAFGAPTNPVHVLDLAFVLPLLLIAAVSLWRRQPLGAVLGVVLLFKIDTLVLAILSMALFQWWRGQTLELGLVIAFAIVAVLALAATAQAIVAVRRSTRRAPG